LSDRWALMGTGGARGLKSGKTGQGGVRGRSEGSGEKKELLPREKESPCCDGAEKKKCMGEGKNILRKSSPVKKDG